MDEHLAREFVTQASRIYTLLDRYQANERASKEQARAFLLEAAGTGCSLLDNAVFMDSLVADAQRLADQVQEHHMALRDITQADHFEYFLQREAALLQAAGADGDFTSSVIKRCREARKSASRGTLDVKDFREALRDARTFVCDLFSDLEAETVNQQGRSRWGRRLWGVVWIVCGGVIVALNASTLAPSIGLSAAGVAASGVVGEAVMNQGVSDLRNVDAG